jgi:uncharacterized protein
MSVPKPVFPAEFVAHWEALRDRQIVFPWCNSCGTLQRSLQLNCSNCLRPISEWRRIDGNGAVHSFVWYMQDLDPRTATVSPFAAALPYNVALIELDAGPVILSTVESVTFGELEVGQRVVPSFVDAADGWVLLKFRRTADGNEPGLSE